MVGVGMRVVVGAAAAVLWAGAALGQTFVSQGPAPRFGQTQGAQSADAPPNGTGAGEVQAIVPDPALGANTYFAGTANGGIWSTSNGGVTWTPLTDKQASLSVGSLALDPTDKSGKTLIAGVGLTSGGDWDQFNTLLRGRGGQQTGLLYTTNGGTSWGTLGGTALQGQSVIGAAARGNTILAATFETTPGATGFTQTSTGAQYGLYRSTNGGGSFSLVSGSSGLGSGPVSSLAADAANISRFYAAVTSVSNPAQTSVYVSNDTGATWSPVFTTANSNGTIGNTNQSVIGLATGPSGSVALTVTTVNSGGSGSLSGVFLSQDGGATWHQLNAAPNVVPGGSAPLNLHVAIDPTNANVVYLTGDYYQTCINNPPGSACTAPAYRVTYDPANDSSSATSLTFEGTAAQNFGDANTAHGGSRALAFTSTGALLMASDGGIYQRANPQGAGSWSGLNGDLSTFAPYAIAFDANSKRLAIAAQNNGTSLQSAPGSLSFTPINTGAGTNVAINDRTLAGLSAIYSSAQNLSFLNRRIVDTQGNTISSTYLTCNGGSDCGQTVDGGFLSPIVLNRTDPTRIAMGGKSDVFVARDLLNAQTLGSDDLALTDVGNTGGPTTIAYGTRDNPNALLVGGNGGVFISSTATAGSLTNLPNYPGVIPTNVLFDPRSQQRFFVADSNDLWGVTNGTAAAATVNFNQLTANLPAGFIRPTSLEFVANNGVNALLVGGLNTPFSCTSAPNGCVIASNQSPITIADSDANGSLSNWRAFGLGLPNALVSALSYNPSADVLSVGLVGRGAWLLYDVTSYFPQATVLQFGLANNNSAPDASLLTDGTVGSRPLIKYGTGTLLVSGDATYTGGTTIENGTLQLGTGSTSGSILGNVTFCSSSLDANCNPTTGKFLIFDEPSAYTFDGAISGPGQIILQGSGTVTLTANSAGFVGSSLVTGGGLVIGPDANPNASLGGSVTVQNGALVAGHGTIGGSLFNPSGVVASLGTAAPLSIVAAVGTSVVAPSEGGVSSGTSSSFKVGGNYVQGSSGTLLVGLSPSAGAQLSVTGSAGLAGTLNIQAMQTQRYVPFSRFAIVIADGGVSGTFDQLTGVFPALPLSVRYLPNEVDLMLGGFAGANANQQAVANALNAAYPNATGDFASVLDTVVNLPAAQMQQALSSFGGQIYADLAEVSLQDRRLFLGAMDDRLRLISDNSPSAAVLGGLPGGSLHAPWGSGGNATQLAALADAINDANAEFIPDPVGLAVAANTAQARAPAAGNVWARGFGQFGSIDDSPGAFGSSYSSGGGAIGADIVKNRDRLFGIALGGGVSSVSLNTNPETGTISYLELGAYGATALGSGFELDGAGVFSHDYYDVNRGVLFAGTRRNASSSHGGNDGVFDVGISWPYIAGGWDVTPRLGFSYYHIGQSTFSESGAGGLDLTVNPQSLNALFSRFGVAIAHPMVVGNTTIVPEVRGAWFHNFLDQQGQSVAAFAGSPSFTQTGAPVGPDGADIGIGLGFSLGQTVFPAQASGFLQYDATLASHATLNTFAGGLRLKW